MMLWTVISIGISIWTIVGILFLLPSVLDKDFNEGLQEVYRKSPTLPIWFKHIGFTGVMIFLIYFWPLRVSKFFKKAT
jgi:hypothetical protein